MVYEGTVTVIKVAKNILRITAADFDADAEETTIDLRTYRMEGAQDFTMQVHRTVGTTDVVDIKLQATNIGTSFHTILIETGVNADGWDAIEDRSCQQIKILVTTVGSGNTLTVVIYATIN